MKDEFNKKIILNGTFKRVIVSLKENEQALEKVKGEYSKMLKKCIYYED